MDGQQQPTPTPVRFPLLISAENRDETTLKDAKLLNGYVEVKGERDIWVYKRPGLAVNTTLAAGAGMGLFNWGGDVYAITAGVLYKNGVSVATGLNTAGGVYTFSVSLGASPRMFIQNGVAAYTYGDNLLPGQFTSWSYGGWASAEEQTWRHKISPAAVVATVASNVLTSAAHTRKPGEVVVFTTTGTLPAPLAIATSYYILQDGWTVNEFKVSLTYEGVVVDITDVGTGTHHFGSVAPLSNVTPAIVGTAYTITYTVTGRTAGTFTLSFGGQSSAGLSASGTFSPTATTVVGLIVTPTTDFDGTLLFGITPGFALVPVLSNSLTTCTVNHNSDVLTNIPDTSVLRVGASVNGEGIPADAIVLSIDSATQVTLDQICLVTVKSFHATASEFMPPYTLSGITPSTSSILVDAGIRIIHTVTGLVAGEANVTQIVSDTSLKTNVFPQAGFMPFIAPFDFDVQNKTASSIEVTFTNPGTPIAGFVKGSAYLNGTSYILTPSSYVNGSDFNDPSHWSALNSIYAMVEPDAGVFITKQLVYVLVMKSYSVEAFVDIGNLIGSPLKSAQGMKLNVGCKSADSVQIQEGTLLWIGQQGGGSIVVMMMEAMKAEVVSTPAIERLLQSANYTTVWSWLIRISGHRFYGITLPSSNLTLVYDLTTKHWMQWTDSSGNYLPICSSVNDASQKSLMQHSTNGKIYQMSTTTYADDGVLFPVDIYTPNWDAGMRKKKYLKLIDFVGDQVEGSILNVRNSDDDYQTWTNFRPVDLSKKRAVLTNCGTFRRRAYHLRHLANTPMRLQAMELQLDIGTL